MAKKAQSKKTVQPTVNIGLIGHVDHGKTTLLERLSGKWADTHSEEIKRGITIRLGYANATIFQDKKTKEYNTTDGEFVRAISFVDAPGHESLMATMLAGATIMDGALVLVAANEACPQPQTREHLMALEIIGIKNIVVVQNKIDLISEEEAIANHKQIKQFLATTPFKDAPIIPISAQHNVGISALLDAIEKTIPTPKRETKDEPRLLVARSFDINKPGSKIKDMVGGVLGGALLSGKLKEGMDIEIRPGYEVTEKNQKVYKPLVTSIQTLQTGKTKVDEIVPGGSVAVLTSLDPSVVKSDHLSGSLVGIPGTLPPVYTDFYLEVHLLERVVGMEEKLSVDPIKKGEMLLMNVNSASTVGIVDELGKKKIHCRLKLPVCADPGARITISRMIGNRFRLIGYGILQE